MKISRIIIMAVVIGAGFAMAAFAQDYPAKPVKVIVPYTEGSATDVFGRLLGEKLSSLWGQPVTVENIPGAGGVGTAAAAKAAPDGYTLLVHSGSFAVYPVLYEKLPFDITKDFMNIAPIAKQPLALVVGQNAGMKKVSELVAAAKAQSGQMKYGSAGAGTSTHLVAEKFKNAAGIEVIHVPYKGGPEATADTVAGKVTYWFPPVAIALKGVKEGKLVALGVSGTKRSSVLPDVPTLIESGFAGLDDTGWWGVWAPAGTPPAVADKLAKDVARAIAAPEVQEKLAKIGAEPMSMAPAEFTKFVKSETESAARIVKAAGIKKM